MPSPFAPIPMPQNGMQAFDQGYATSQQRYRALLQNNIQQQQMDINKQLLPGQIQNQQNANTLSPLTRQYLQAQIDSMNTQAQTRQKVLSMLNGDSSPGSPPMNSNPSTMPSDNMAPGGQNDQNIGTTVFNPNGGAPAYRNAVGGNTQPTPVINRGSVPQATPDPNAMGGMASSQNGTSLNTGNNQPGSYAEQVVSPGDPSKYGMDKLAGMDMGGFSIPKIQTSKGDGYEDDRYPSGKIVRRTTGLNTQQKAQSQADAKESINNVNDAQNIVNTLNTSAQLQNLLDKKTPTGWGSYVKNAAGLSNQDQGSIQELSNNLQLSQAHQAASRGSNMVLGLVGTGKPSIGKGYDQNTGLNLGIAKQNLAAFNTLKSRWEAANPGREFPVKLPDVSGVLRHDPDIQLVTLHDTVTGERRQMPRSYAESFIKGQTQGSPQ